MYILLKVRVESYFMLAKVVEIGINIVCLVQVTAKTFEEYFIVEPKLVTIQGRRQRAYKVLSPRNINLLF